MAKKPSAARKKAPAKSSAKRKSPPKRSMKALLFKLLLLSLVVMAAAWVYIDAWLMERFDGRKWAIPATVYARPLELYEGKVISPWQIMRELKAASYQEGQLGRSRRYQYREGQLDIYMPAFAYWDGKTAAQKVRLSFADGKIKRISSTHKQAALLRLPPLEIGSVHPNKHEDRLLVSINDVPKTLIDGLLVTEDRDFYQHFGLSPKSIIRALWSNMKSGRVVAGGSTLTQQLVKNFFLTSERSLSRKALEAIMAISLEMRASKDEILEAYVNEVFIAQDGRRAIHGFGKASQYLFAEPLAKLKAHQSALLVAMMKGPSYYNPFKHPERAKTRRNLVLRLMAEEGMLTDSQAKWAQSRPLDVVKYSAKRQDYSAYLDLVRRQLRLEYSQQDLMSQGLRIFTNLDPQWQWQAQKKLKDGIHHLKKQYGKKAAGMNGAAVIVDNATAEVIAIVGGVNYLPGSFNRALDARRPIGSLVKPAIYLTALEQGYTLSSRLSDAPLTVKFDAKTWQPKNYDKKTHGLHPVTQKDIGVPLYVALAKSYNVAAARLGLTLGLEQVIETLKKLGVEEPIPYVPSILLGAIELSPLAVSQMYHTLASQGFYSRLRVIREVTDSQGEALRRFELSLDQRIASDKAYLIEAAMAKVMTEGTGRSSQRLLAGRVIAGKSGTTNDKRDSWFAGFDKKITTVVWLGRDDNKPLPVTGSSGALPIWSAIMEMQREQRGIRSKPEGIEEFWVDSQNSKISGKGCDHAVKLPFIIGTEPVEKADCQSQGGAVLRWFKNWIDD